MADNIAHALRDTLISPNVSDSNMEAANVVDAIAGAGTSIARALRALGTNGAGEMGAIELLSKELKEASERLAGAIGELAEAINTHG